MTLDFDRFRSDLETERARLTAALTTVNHKGSLDEETGDLSSGPGDHLGDHGTDTFMRELDNGLEENAEHLIEEIDAALGRIENGTYGACAVCGRPIDEERLEALPYARLCIDDARRLARS
jgi:DnaK suppressor protein